MRKHVLIFFLLSALTAAAQTEPGQYSFTLQQAIDHALKNNATAINSARDIEIAQQKKRETTATGLPQINGGVDYTNNIEIPLTVLPAQLLNPDAPEGTFAAVAFSPKQTMGARATLSQLLFDGSYLVALRAAKTYLEYYRNYKVKTDNDVREMVIDAYGNVLLAQESILVLERNKQTLDKTLSDTRETFKNGLIEEETVEQLQITQFTVNSSLNNARRLKDIAMNMLKVNLGMKLEDNLVLTDKLEDLTQNNVGMSFAQDELNLENNIDYKISQNFIDQRRLELQREKSKALPSLSANLNYGVNSFSKNFDFFDSKQQWYDYSTLGVSLNVPIFSSFARSARTQQARIAFEQAKTQHADVEQKLKLQYSSAKSQYDYSVEEYTNSKSNLALAERIERKQQTKFTEGLSSSFDFSEAQRQLYTAQQNYLQSMVNVINRRAALEKITNGK